ncbi:unnamed protein product [Arabidopsis thaliana]|nr:uncharacterized protein AT1G54575 [Arabidopsis thaliana]AAT71930.1 At1g54575 [Arabidopsis thaliana]AAU44412.1 hypothetical protein AT1G54575 [Arabidopsis thaliana]AAU45221.1 At1g54575 [Arabidopsis thaliana]AAV63855.1 hypothetical protein At1g54575 [Arabidopsis thaliana]AEE33120.1 hypothetical protein AT1G54575 [Arabidopsis thaliana]|eukprot:NP_974028.1 hypothetical protein AT1G54575 [Arabidopsis thaliana]
MVDHHLKADRVVARVEKSVNLVIGHRQTQRQAGSREYEGESKQKYTTKKIPKWKHNDSERKIGQKQNNETPTMIVAGGWVRPNRAMWASPPNSSSSKPQKNN